MIHINLVEKAIKGNEEAFETLVRGESEKLYRTAYIYVRNKDDALDVVQETVCKAFVSIGQLKEPAYFSTWLMKILIRTAYDLLKKRKRHVLTGDDYFNMLHDERDLSTEDELDLIEAISQLNGNYQTAVILFYFHDHSIRTIAEMMERPEGTIKTYLHRAKTELKRKLKGASLYEQKTI